MWCLWERAYANMPLIGTLELEITGSCEPLDVEAVNQTLVFWKNSRPGFQSPFFIIMAE